MPDYVNTPLPAHLKPFSSGAGRLASHIHRDFDRIMAPLPALPNPMGGPKFAKRAPPWETIGSTEVVKKPLEVSFANPIRLTYFFERPELLCIDIYDQDSLGKSWCLLQNAERIVRTRIIWT